MSDQQFQKSVKHPPLSNEGKALIVLCFTFLLSVSANFYQFLVSCQDAHTIEILANTVQAKTNKIDSLQQQDVASVQPDAISSASDGESFPVMTYRRFADNDRFIDCLGHPEILFFSSFLTPQQSFISAVKNVGTCSVDFSYCFDASNNILTSKIVFPTWVALVNNRPFWFLRGPY